MYAWVWTFILRVCLQICTCLRVCKCTWISREAGAQRPTHAPGLEPLPPPRYIAQLIYFNNCDVCPYLYSTTLDSNGVVVSGQHGSAYIVAVFTRATKMASGHANGHHDKPGL